MTPNPAIFAPLLIASLVLFCVQLLPPLLPGRPGPAGGPLRQHRAAGSGTCSVYAFGQKRVVSKPFGVNHFVIFWSFLILLLANGEFLVNGLFPAVRLALLPAPLYHGSCCCSSTSSRCWPWRASPSPSAGGSSSPPVPGHRLRQGQKPRGVPDPRLHRPADARLLRPARRRDRPGAGAGRRLHAGLQRWSPGCLPPCPLSSRSPLGSLVLVAPCHRCCWLS